MQEDVPMKVKVSMFMTMISLIIMFGLTLFVYIVDWIAG